MKVNLDANLVIPLNSEHYCKINFNANVWKIILKKIKNVKNAMIVVYPAVGLQKINVLLAK